MKPKRGFQKSKKSSHLVRKLFLALGIIIFVVIISSYFINSNNRINSENGSKAKYLFQNLGLSILQTIEDNPGSITGAETFEIQGDLTIQDTAITNCTPLNTANTIYTLQNNVNSNMTCFTITASNVTLDGNGKTITYGINGSNFGYGVYSFQQSLITVRNAILMEGNTTGNSKHAIVYEQVTNGTIINNNITLMGGFSTGIKLDSSSSWPKNNVTSNIITTNGSSSVGISLINTANYNIITLNTIVNTGSSGYGVYLFSSSSSNLVTLNNITTGGSSTHGIRAQSSANSNNITSNLINILDNNAYGIDIMTTSNLVTSNNITTNGTSAYGISLRSNFNNVSYNSITTTGYGAEAIYVYSNANSNLIASNNVVTSGENGWGIALSSAFNNNITSNTFTTSGVGAYGLYLAISNNTRFGLNTLNISNAVRLWVHSLSNYTYFINNSITVRNYTFNDIRFETNQMDGYWLVDQYLENYTFNGLGGKINVQNSQSGELSYLQSVNGTGKNFSSDIRILNNSVYVNSGQAGLNKSASVSLYNLPTNFVAPIILKDGVACPSSICANLTSLNAGNVTFNVTGWSNYSIAEDPTALTACATLNTANTAYTLQSNVNSNMTCFTITANNVTLNGNGKTISFGMNATTNRYGILVTSNRTTIQNLNLIEGNTAGFKYGIFYNNSINGSILNNNITILSGTQSAGIYFNKAKNITILSNNITVTEASAAQSYGIYFNSDCDSNNLTSNIINATEPTSTADGISFKSGSDQNTLTSNIIFAGGNGISVSNSNSNTFLSNSVVMAGSGAGILFTNSNSSSINSNNFTAGGEFANGVTMTSSKSNALASNLLTVFGSGGYGISLTSAGSNNFTSNILNVSLGDRIAISSSNNNFFINNSILSRNYSYYDFNFLTAGINGTWLIDQYIENYTFTGVGGKINVKNSQFGEISYLQMVNGTGNNFSSDIRILNNSVFVNSSQTGINKSANITFYNLPTNFITPIILKDGSACPSSICTNLTSLNAGNVTLNVTGWSNYSIGEGPDSFPTWINNIANILITYANDTASQFNVTWQDDIGISTVFFESNFTGIPVNYTMNNISGPVTNRTFNFSAIFPAGTFYWKSYANDTINQWNVTSQLNFTVLQAASTVNLTLNSSKNNLTLNSANNISINCTRISGEGNIYLYQNGVLINSGLSPIGNITYFNNSGRYNLTCAYNETQNYTSSFDTLWINLDSLPTTTLISPASGYSDSSATDSTSIYNINFSCNATDDLQLKNISLYLTNQNNQLFDLNQSTRISRTSNSSSWNLNLSQGTYSWNCLTYDNNSQSSFASSNRSLTLSYTSSSSSSSGGGGGTTPSAPSTEPSTPPTNPAPEPELVTPVTTEPERTEETATTDEIQTALARGELTVEIISKPTETAESRTGEALAGRAMGTAPSEPSIETRPAYRQQTIDVVLENRGDKTINLVGRIKSEPATIENRKEIEEKVREMIIEQERARFPDLFTTGSVTLIPLTPEETATTDEVQTALARGELTVEITSRPAETTESETAESKTKEALASRTMGTAPSEPSIETRSAYQQETIKVVLENRGDKAINLIGRIKSEPVTIENRKEIEEKVRERIVEKEGTTLTEKEIIEKVQKETETIGLIEQENVQYLARQKIKSYLSTPGGIKITGNHILGNLLRTKMISSENIIIAAGGKIEREIKLNPGISAKQKPIEIEFLSGDQVVLEKEVYSEKPIVSTAIDFDPESKLVDIYLVIPPQEDGIDNGKEYFLEFSLHKKDSWISSDAEIYGPYLIQNNEGMVFAQQYQLDSQFAPEEYEIETTVSKDGKIVTKNTFPLALEEEKIKIAAEKEPIVGKSVMTEKEIIEKVQKETETIGLIEQENVQYLAKQKIKSYLSTPGGIKITGNHILGNLLRTELVSSEKITLAPGEKIETKIELNPGISAKQKPIEIEFLSGDQVVLEKEVYSEKPIVSTAIDFDPESKLVDIYLVIPPQEDGIDNGKEYFLEFSLHKKDSWISSDAEIYGPYLIQNNEGMVFAQQYQLDSQFASEEYEIETTVSKDGKIVTKNKFPIRLGEEKIKIAAEKEPIVGKSVFQKTEKITKSKAFFYSSGILMFLAFLTLMISNFLSIRRFTTAGTWPISNKTINSLEDNSLLEEKAVTIYLKESTIIRLPKESEAATDQLGQEFSQISQQLEGLKIPEKEKMESPTPKTKTVITEPFNLKKPSLIRTAPETKTYGKIDRPSFGRRITKEYFQDLHLTDKLSRIDEEISQLNKIDWEKKKIMIGLPAAKNHGSNCPLLKRRKSEERWGKNIVTKPVSRIITKEYFENLHLTDELNRINEDISQLGKIEPEKKKVLVNLPIAKDHGQRCPLLKESKPKKNLKANIPDYKTSFKSQPKLDRELRDIQDLIGEKKNYSIKKLGPGNIITRINKQRKLK